MIKKRGAKRISLIDARRVKTSPAFAFSKRIRNFFVQNNLGEIEAAYFQKSLKYLHNEEAALAKLKIFIGLPPAERQELLRDEFELVRSMSFRLGEGRQRPLRTQPKNRKIN
jgi:hypothetical protein